MIITILASILVKINISTMKYINTLITGTGSFIPEGVVTNSEFENRHFYNQDGTKIDNAGEEIVNKFKDITGIQERRYSNSEDTTSDIAAKAAKLAIEDAGIDKESIDQIIFAHNFGNVVKDTIQTDIVPSLASRVKHLLDIKNPFCIPYDILFGCPGWIQGVIQAESYIKSGIAKRCLVIGAEMLSRVVDKYDRDSMIFADGAGATIVEAVEEDEKRGLLSISMMSHTIDEVYYLYLGKSSHPKSDPNIKYIKMDGRKIYEYALNNVPLAMKIAVERSGIEINNISKILIHQANEKMDEQIVKRFYRLFKMKTPKDIMPMSIQKYGNSSVATVPTLYDLILKRESNGHSINKGDYLLFASVGAGMNINAFVYKQ